MLQQWSMGAGDGLADCPMFLLSVPLIDLGMLYYECTCFYLAGSDSWLVWWMTCSLCPVTRLSGTSQGELELHWRQQHMEKTGCAVHDHDKGWGGSHPLMSHSCEHVHCEQTACKDTLGVWLMLLPPTTHCMAFLASVKAIKKDVIHKSEGHALVPDSVAN